MFNTTTNTIIPSQPGYEVLIIRKRGMIIEPVIAWSIITDAADDENIRHWIDPITSAGDMQNVAGKLPWAIRRPGGVIEYGGQYFSRPIDFEAAVASTQPRFFPASSPVTSGSASVSAGIGYAFTEADENRQLTSTMKD